MPKPIKPLWPELWPHLWRRFVEHASKSMLARSNVSPEALLGHQGEEAAYWYLRNKGYVMVSRNYRPEESHGEVDLIGWDGETLVFVEVKARRSNELVTPDAAVDRKKQRHVIAASREYRRRLNLMAEPYRFDIVSILATIDPSTNSKKFSDMKIEHIPNAFRDGTS